MVEAGALQQQALLYVVPEGCSRTDQNQDKSLDWYSFFLFLPSLSNPALPDRIAQRKANNLRCQTCHAENRSLKILTHHVAPTEPLISSSSWSY